MRNLLGHLTWTVIANFWASGSTFILFVVVSRVEDASTLGRFTLAVALSQLTVQLVDGGYGPLLIREANLGGRDPLSVLSWGFRSRVLRVGLAVPVITIVLIALRWQPSAVAAVDVLVVGSLAYGFSLILYQATRRSTAYNASLFGNGVLYILVSIGISLSPIAWRILPLVILGPALALLLIGMVGTQRIIGVKPARDLAPTDRQHFSTLMFANTVTSSVDSVFLGALNPQLAGRYAMNQRPAFALVPLSVGIAAVALPRLATADELARDRLRSRLPFLLPLPFVIGAAAYLVLPPILDALYGHRASVQPLALACLFGAYAFGTLSQLSSALLVMRHQTRVVAITSILQMLVVISATLIGAAAGAILVVAVGILLSRMFLVSWQMSALYRRLVPYRMLTHEQI